MSLEVKQVLVTPEFAKHWLSTSDQHIDQSRVRNLLNAMEADGWDSAKKRRPVMIHRRKTGTRRLKLKNGHHRLSAVVQFGKPVLMYVESDGFPHHVKAVDDE